MSGGRRFRQVVQLTIDPLVVGAVDGVAGHRWRSQWIEQACRERLERVGAGVTQAGLFDDPDEMDAAWPGVGLPVGAGPAVEPVRAPVATAGPVGVPAGVSAHVRAGERALVSTVGKAGVAAARAALAAHGAPPRPDPLDAYIPVGEPF